MAKVKFIRLGLQKAVDVSKYDSYKQAGSIVFAKVNAGNGTWSDETSTYNSPSYYIWANGIEYHVADASALAYALECAERANQDISTLKGDDTVVGSISKSIKDALDAYRPKAAHISELVDVTTSNVTITAQNTSISINCDEAATTDTVTAAIKVGYLDKNTNIPVGTNIQSLVDMIFNPDLGVTPVKPAAGITNTSTIAGDYEIGSEIKANLTATYTDGYFKAIDNWGGNQAANCPEDTEHIIFKKNNVICGSQDTAMLTDEGDAISYTANIPYGKSQNIPVSKKGNYLKDVSILEGKAISQALKYTGYYRYYYVIGSAIKLTAEAGWEDVVAVCAAQHGLLKNDVIVIGNEPIIIGDGINKAYLYVLIPEIKITPTFEDAFGNKADMAVINDNLVCPRNHTVYKLLTINPDGTTSDKYKNIIIKK